MLIGHHRWTVVGLLATAAVVMSCSSSALASPARLTLAASTVPDEADAASALETQLHVSPAQAFARLDAGAEWQIRGEPLLADLGSRYAGAHLEYGPDGFPAAIDVYVQSPEPADYLNAADGEPIPINIHAVELSLSQLEDAASAIAPQVGGLDRIALDFAHNSLIARPDPATYSKMTGAEVAAMRARLTSLGTAVSFRPQVWRASIDSCNTSVCDPPVRGGSYSQSSSGLSCTSGFVAAQGGGAQNVPVWLMTAGHCIQQGNYGWPWYMEYSNHTLYQIGTGSNYAYTAGQQGPDWGLIKLQSPFTSRSSSANWVIAPGNSEHAITGWLAPIAGETLCFTGTTSGIVCGSTTFENAASLWETTGMPAQGGDSGAPVWDGSAARGILDGILNGSAYFTDVGVIWRATGTSNGGAEPMTG